MVSTTEDCHTFDAFVGIARSTVECAPISEPPIQGYSIELPVKSARATPEVAVKQHSNHEYRVEASMVVRAAPDLVYDILTHPDNHTVFRPPKECTYRNVVREDEYSQLVEVEHSGVWSFMFLGGRFCTRLLVEQSKSQGKIHFWLKEPGMLKSFGGYWTLQPCYITGESQEEIGTILLLEQSVVPAVAPPPLANRIFRGTLARQVQNMFEDVVLEIKALKLGNSKLTYPPDANKLIGVPIAPEPKLSIQTAKSAALPFSDPMLSEAPSSEQIAQPATPPVFDRAHSRQITAHYIEIDPEDIEEYEILLFGLESAAAAARGMQDGSCDSDDDDASTVFFDMPHEFTEITLSRNETDAALARSASHHLLAGLAKSSSHGQLAGMAHQASGGMGHRVTSSGSLAKLYPLSCRLLSADLVSEVFEDALDCFVDDSYITDAHDMEGTHAVCALPEAPKASSPKVAELVCEDKVMMNKVGSGRSITSTDDGETTRSSTSNMSLCFLQDI